MSIKPLSKETIKLINSTQVISSIYSAIKELVENSLDAQAQNIEVNLVDNGLSLIEVKDNGIGINRDDAQYMALPAYTSKIKDFNDLDLLSTYGFRGEGLTAVCQVADVIISTKTVNDETMICYTLDNEGHIVASELSHGLTGTTIQMRHLFKNMPVRRNILNNKKIINQEMKAIELLLKMYAICKPSIRFMLRVNSNTIFTKPSCKSVIEAIKAVLGTQVFSKLTHINKSFSQTEMQLFIPKKEVKDSTEVSQVGLQFLCVNDRPIRSKEIEKKINKRVAEYFNQNGSSSRKFIYCLILKVDPSMLDVNLEPNKDKVFLQNEAAVLSELDNSLLSFYELQDSQMSTQNDIENINYNGNINELEKESQKEKEWPACKKRKLNLKDENIHDISVSNKNILIAKQKPDNAMQKSDNDFLKGISGPILSDSDSNDAEEFHKKKLIQKDKEPEMMHILESENENSELFDLNPNVQKKVIEENLSQLPMVDLGDDFDWEEIVNKNNTISHSDGIETVPKKPQITDVIWSKGQVPGLQGGVTVAVHNRTNNDVDNKRKIKENQETQPQDSELFDFHQDVKKINDSEELISNNNNASILEDGEFDWDINVKNTRKITPSQRNSDKPPGISKQRRKSLNICDDPTQPKIPFAGDNACLTTMGPSAFAMYCATARTQILKQHPELTPAEVAVYMNKQWKEISSEEREYYRDLANQHNQSVCNTSLNQTFKKSKPQLSRAEKEKNRKQLVNMLGNMKMNKAEVKNESMIMRTFVPWSISVPMVTEKFKKPVTKLETSIVGSLNSLLWIINLTSKLFIFDITELHTQLNIQGYDISQINAEYVKDLVDKWLLEKNDLSIFHPLHTMQEV